VAVTVGQQTPLVVLDEGDRIVGVGQGAESRFGPLVGEIVWDCYPGSEALFKPHYDAARTSGEHVDFAQFYDGNVLRVRAVPRTGGRLELYWQQLGRLDTLTLESLLETLRESLETLAAESSAAERAGARRALRLVEGGGR
jgi:hypothetical protein